MLDSIDNQPGSPERAYTAPVESDASTVFQFHSDLTPPSVKRRRREKHRRKWAAAIICILLVFLCLALAVSIFLLRYQIVFQNDEGGMALQIVRRDSAVIKTPDGPALPEGQADELENRAPPGGARYEWNGARLQLEAPEAAGNLSWSSVYQEWSACVAAVTVTDKTGNLTRGSAVVMTEDGVLMTSSHVVLYAESIQVDLQGISYPAELIGLDIASDLAVIQIQASELKAAEFGLSENVYPGDEISVMGASYTGSVGIYTGTVTAYAQNYAYRGFVLDLFELDLPLGSQCSGAPLMNRYGQVIGIVNTELSEALSGTGVSFAVPMSYAKCVIDQLLQYGYVPGRPSSGLTVAEIPTAYAMYYRYPACIYVTAVSENSTAYEAGIRKGDLIISANGVKIQSIDQLYSIINAMSAGDELELELYRNGDYATLSFPLMDAARPAD